MKIILFALRRQLSTNSSRLKIIMANASEQDWTIKDKTVIVTGANTGIGKAAAQELAKRGARRVILACRNTVKGEEAVKEIREKTGCGADVVQVRELDLSSIQSVRKFAADIQSSEPELNVLVNNAGIPGPEKRTMSVDGNEITFATNHLGHFALTTLLLDFMKKSAPSRVVNVAAHRIAFWMCRPGFHIDDVNFDKRPETYSTAQAYSQTKLANVLFTRELQKRLQESGTKGVTSYVLHPGVIKTDIDRNLGGFWQTMFSWFGMSPEKGAKTTVFCATEPGLEKLSGSYFADCKVVDPGPIASDAKMQEKLWQLSEELLNKVPPKQ